MNLTWKFVENTLLMAVLVTILLNQFVLLNEAGLTETLDLIRFAAWASFAYAAIPGVLLFSREIWLAVEDYRSGSEA